MKPDSTAVDQYLTTVPKPKRQELERIRAIIRRVTPEAEELISYMMPAFKYKNKPLIYYAAFKEHLSLFPTSGPTEALKDDLRDFKVSKGTIQFNLDHPLPDALIEKIIRERIKEIEA